MARYCSACGKQIREYAKFCDSCGKELPKSQQAGQQGTGLLQPTPLCQNQPLEQPVYQEGFAQTPKQQYIQTPKQQYIQTPQQHAQTPQQLERPVYQEGFAQAPQQWYAQAPQQQYAQVPQQQHVQEPQQQERLVYQEGFAQLPQQQHAQTVSKKEKSKLPLILGIGFVSVLVIGIAIALIIGNITGKGFKAPGLGSQELASSLTSRTETAFEPTPSDLESALFTPEPTQSDLEPVSPTLEPTLAPESTQSDLEFALPIPEPTLPPEPTLTVETTPSDIETVLRTPEPTPIIVYEPYVFDEANAIPASRLLEYYKLNDREMKLYEEIKIGLLNLEPLIYIETQLDIDDYDDFEMIIKVNGARTAVHPEMFWVSGKSDWAKLSDGTTIFEPHYLIDGQSFGAEYDGSWYTLPTDGEIAEAKAWIEKQQIELKNVLEELPIHNGMTPYELELAVHDWLCDNNTYDKNAPNRDSLYGALIEKASACEGYSNAFQYIMGLMGIECLMIYGTLGQGESAGDHGWNAVKLDGQWYHVDVTSDATTLKTIDFPCHQYFNRTDGYMYLQHSWFDGLWRTDTGTRVNAPIVCTETDYNYFVMNGQRPITSDDDFMRTVPDIAARARAEGRQMFEIEFDPSYASPSDISDKQMLLDSRLRDDIQFYYTNWLVYGVFEYP